MKNVPTPMKIPTLSDDDSAHRVRPVSAVGAALESSSQVVLMKLRDPGNEMDFPFALSPSGATQLARQLDQAVQQYLYPDENQS